MHPRLELAAAPCDLPLGRGVERAERELVLPRRALIELVLRQDGGAARREHVVVRVLQQAVHPQAREKND